MKYYITPILLIFIISVQDCFAVVEFTDHLIQSDHQGYGRIKIVDLDDDHDMDIIDICLDGNALAIWWNDGNQNFDAQVIDNNITRVFYVDTIDLDGDGDMDMFGSSHDHDINEIYWWENNNQEFTRHEIETSLEYIQVTTAADIDMDGDIDILAGAINSESIHWFENHGIQNFTEHIITTTYNSIGSLAILDIDSDNDMDFLSSSRYQPSIDLWENEGNENFTQHLIDSSFASAHCIKGVDLDLDNDIDIIGAAHEDDDVAWWENDGEGNFTRHTIRGNFEWANWVEAADMDNDGDIDIVGSAYLEHGYVWWENRGNQIFSQHIIVDDFYRPAPFDVGDLDSDGDLDIVGASTELDEVRWWEHVDVPNMVIPVPSQYFDMISVPLIPADLSANLVFRSLNDLIIVYQDNGFIYSPEMNLNTIGNIQLTKAYRVFCDQPSNWVIEGQPFDQGLEFHLNGNMWNWISYPFNYSIPIEIGLSATANEIAIVMDDRGRFWIPELINTIGDLMPGEGYIVFSHEDIDFQYNTGDFRLPTEPSNEAEIELPEDAPDPTGLPYIFLVRFTENLKSSDPAFIEIYDGDLLVGKSIILPDYKLTPVITWGGSEEYGIAGFKNGNPATIRVLSADGSNIPINNEETTVLFGKNAYADVKLDLNDFAVPGSFAVNSVYPNPFNPSTQMTFSIPEAGEVSIIITNILGQEVFKQSQIYQVGNHQFVFDANLVKTELVSGVYFLKVDYDGMVNTQKLLLMK